MVKLEVRDFNLKQTLECGQCFNFEKIYDAGTDCIKDCIYEYDITAFERWLRIRQEGNELIFCNCAQDEMEKIWIRYFDLDRDYSKIKNAVVKADPDLKTTVEQYYGLRILNQDFVETLISFIISQNKNIPHIKKLVKDLSEKYGHPIGEDGRDKRIFYSFPDISELNHISEQDFRSLKMGFRAPYLRNAVEMLANGRIREDELRSMSYPAARERLKEIKGVGDKVADCVLLFGLGFRNSFPVDVWIKRTMEKLYFHQDTDKKVIEEFAKQKFREFGGYAQQYLFISAKNR